MFTNVKKYNLKREDKKNCIKNILEQKKYSNFTFCHKNKSFTLFTLSEYSMTDKFDYEL